MKIKESIGFVLLGLFAFTMVWFLLGQLYQSIVCPELTRTQVIMLMFDTIQGNFKQCH